ncbi:MAG: GDSL-type esterase/lipase family protein [Oscillospiraceae bacterium]
MRRNNLNFDKQRPSMFPYVVIVIIAICIAFVFALFWQSKAEKNQQEENPNQNIVITPEVNDQLQPKEKSPLVEKSEMVSTSYFDDAVFIGDSITTGIDGYDILENATVIAHTGVNVDTIKTTPFYETEAGTLTAVETLKTIENAEKIYIMLGANGIAWFPKETLINHYEEFLLSVMEAKPDATIYIQSILPVTQSMDDLANNITNEKIDEYNLALLELAKKLDVYYVDINSSLKDENNALPAEASPGDGMHFGAEYYLKWIDYLRTHTAEE